MIDVTAQMVAITALRGRTLVGGKVMNTPDLDRRDLHQPLNMEIGGGQDFLFGSQSLLKEYPSTHDRDKALLVKLGVDGDVPLAQARINAGLDRDPAEASDGSFFIPKWMRKHVLAAFPANDNHELAAKAA